MFFVSSGKQNKPLPNLTNFLEQSKKLKKHELYTKVIKKITGRPHRSMTEVINSINRKTYTLHANSVEITLEEKHLMAYTDRYKASNELKR